jgi:hypothetical protein
MLVEELISFLDLEILHDIVELKVLHEYTWKNEDDKTLFIRLTAEVAELGGAIIGTHEHSPEHELKQIASICLNWLERRAERGFVDGEQYR